MSLKAGAIVGFLSLIASAPAWGEEVEKKDQPKWAGSEISLNHLATVGTFYAELEQTYNPTVTQNLSIDPRWRINDRITLLGHAGVETELTNSDITSYERQPLLEDIFVQGNYSLPKLPLLLRGSVGLRVILPASKNSWARSLYFGVSPSFVLNRSIELGENFIIQPFGTIRTTFYAAGSQSVVYDNSSIPNCTGDCSEYDHAGGRTSWASFNETLGVNFVFPYRLTGQVAVSWIQSFLYEPVDSEFDSDNTGPDTRYANIYVIELAWDATQHLRLSGGFLTLNDQLTLSSEYQAPFFNRYSQVYLKGTYVF